MFAQETIFIGVQVYKPSCICNLFEERRHFRGGFWPWEQCWGPWTVGRWRSGSFGFGLLYWSYDLWRLQGQVQRKMSKWELLFYETVYSFTFSSFSTNSGQQAKAWLSSGSLVWSFSLEPFSPACTEKRSQLYFQAYLQLPFLISTTESPDRLVNRRTGFSFFYIHTNVRFRFRADLLFEEREATGCVFTWFRIKWMSIWVKDVLHINLKTRNYLMNGIVLM